MTDPQNQSAQHKRPARRTYQRTPSNRTENSHPNSIDSAPAFCPDASEVQKKAFSMLKHPKLLNRLVVSVFLFTLAALLPARAEVKQGSAVAIAVSGTANYIDATG